MKVGFAAGIARQFFFPSLPALPFILLLSACPPPVDTAIATAVSDKLPPTITLTSPITGQTYSGTMTFTGTVTDDATTAGDGKGTLASLSYAVANNELLKGRIKIDPHGNASADTSYGAGVISWNSATKTFSFSLLTIGLTSTLTVSLSATDVNANTISVSVQLLESAGPVITITAPTSTKFTKGTIVGLAGTVSNTKDDTASASDIKTLSWGVSTMGWAGTLDISGATKVVSAANTGFSVSRTYDFVYDPATRTFSTQFYINSGATSLLPVEVSATDVNGHTTKSSLNLYEDAAGPQLEVGAPSISYYTTSPTDFAPITINGTITDYSSVVYVSYQVQSVSNPTYISNITRAYSSGDMGFFNANGDFSFPVAYAAASTVWAHGGSVYVIVTAANAKNESTDSVTLKEDSTPPAKSRH